MKPWILLLAAVVATSISVGAYATETRHDGRIEFSCDFSTLEGDVPSSGEVIRIGEVQYLIDPRTNSIWASRWEAPSDLRISEFSISFAQGDAGVTISLVTGAIRQMVKLGKQGVFFVEGICRLDQSAGL